MAKYIIIIMVLIYVFTSYSGIAQDAAFKPLDHTYVYDISEDGNVRCTWATTIIPYEPTVLYTFSFRGGETKNYACEDSLGQIIDADVNEEGGQRSIAMLLAGYPLNEPYQFNLSFNWDGLMTRVGDRHTLYTSVNVGEPQAASIVVIPPDGARVGTSVVTKGNSSQPFEKRALLGRNSLIWETDDTGNDTDLVFRANFNYYSARMSLMDNFSRLIVGLAAVVVAALLLGYRKRLPGIASKIKERI